MSEETRGLRTVPTTPPMFAFRDQDNNDHEIVEVG
jgi:hypothetical protein